MVSLKSAHARDIEAALRPKGAPGACHFLSESEGLDGRDMPLRSALMDIVGHGMNSARFATGRTQMECAMRVESRGCR